MYKLYILMGSIFSFVALVCGISMGAAAYIEQKVEIIIFCVIFVLVFGAVGVLMFYLAYNLKKQKQEILTKGVKAWGTIVGYDDDTSLYVNGVPGLDVYVACIYNGTEQNFRIKTHQTREDKYPMGATCQISIYQGNAEIVPDSIKFI